MSSWRFSVLADRHRALGSGLEDWNGMGTAWTYSTSLADEHAAYGFAFLGFISAMVQGGMIRPLTRKYGGTGLGLAIVHRFCELMEGEVTVTSEPGIGSSFRVKLPAVLSKPPRPVDGAA